MQRFNIYNIIFSYLWSKNNLKIKLFLLSAILLLMAAKSINVVVPFIFKIVVDSLNHGDLHFAIVMILTYGLVRVSSQFFTECKEAFFVVVEQNSIQKIAIDIFHHLHSLSLRFYLTKKIGSLFYVVERGAHSVETVLKFSSFNIIPTFFEVIIVCIILLVKYNPLYTVIIIITLVLYVIYTLTITKWRAHYVLSLKKSGGEASAKAVDSILNYETVKHFNNEIFEEENYLKFISEYKKLAIKGHISLSILNIGQVFIIALGMVSVCIFAAHDFLVSKLITLGDVVLLNSYLLQFYQPLSNLGFSYQEVKLASEEAENIFKLMDELSEVRNIEQPKFLDYCHGKIEFNNISFGYEPTRRVLHDISFVVGAGETLAIVGKSGAGKSTIAKLLFRFYDPTEGSISLDGEKITEIDVNNLRSMIGVVPQDTILFHDTIYYNIAYGNPYKASIEEVRRVAKLASIDEFIVSLPLGYDTIVGERGLKLSGGERQRISIARVLLKSPQIFIFDEATSSLDTRTEKVIQESIMNISKGYSSIIIAHRLSTIKDADKIIVLDNGRIAESGTRNAQNIAC